ncbi:Putative deoxyribonuclease YjjV [Salmonella enterica subsp. enterica]|nr:Putative deoxyribonuclease YjjV [Salmonella enterica subsp. enterica] [Salmonella enterica subsp. enterica serovar Menston]
MSASVFSVRVRRALKKSSCRRPRRLTFPAWLALAARFPSLYAALGLHPIVIERHADDDPDKLQQALAQQQNVVAVGEIGLDLYRDDPQFARQERFLDAQLQLAKRYDLPVILHSRRTHDKLAMHLKRQSLPRTRRGAWFCRQSATGRTFCATGPIKSASAAPSPTPRASKTRDVMARLPLDALLLETDAPDMPLKGFQGQPNRPEQAARVFDGALRITSGARRGDSRYAVSQYHYPCFGSDGIAAAVRQATLTDIAAGKISFATPRARNPSASRSTSCGVAPGQAFRFAIDAMRMKGIQTHRNLAQRSNKRRQ